MWFFVLLHWSFVFAKAVTRFLPTIKNLARASLTAWRCVFETTSSHVAKTSHWAKVSHWVKVSHWAQLSHWMFHFGFPLLNGGWYRCVCSIILSRFDRLFLSNGICGCVASCVFITSHVLLILFVVQNCRGRPRLLCSVSRGSANLMENAAWCSGCCLSLLKTCPRSFSFLSLRISVSDLICLPSPSDGALRVSLSLLYTYSLELLRCANAVCSFNFFANPLVGLITQFQLLWENMRWLDLNFLLLDRSRWRLVTNHHTAHPIPVPKSAPRRIAASTAISTLNCQPQATASPTSTMAVSRSNKPKITKGAFRIWNRQNKARCSHLWWPPWPPPWSESEIFEMLHWAKQLQRDAQRNKVLPFKRDVKTILQHFKQFKPTCRAMTRI